MFNKKKKRSNVEFQVDEKYKSALYDIFDKSQDDFEKQLSYISGGALGLSLLFLEKVIEDLSKADSKWLLTLGWILLALTLFINLTSHLFAAVNSRKTIREYDAKNPDYKENAGSRTKFMLVINWITLFLLIFGILAIIIFVTINL